MAPVKYPVQGTESTAEIRMYDRVLLKSGYEASIVEIFGGGALFMADVDYPSGTETEDVSPEQIECIINISESSFEG